MDTKNIENYLKSFGKQVVKRAKKNLNSGGKGGGNLDKSIDFKIVEDESGVAVQFFMADYGTFQDKGVKGIGGEIKSGTHKGKWSGRRHYITWEGKRKDSPYKYGSGSGKKGGMSKGIGSFIKRKGLQPRSEGGQFMTTKGLKIAIMKVLWIKGIHGISFFQESLNYGLKNFGKDLLGSVKEDIINSLTQVK